MKKPVTKVLKCGTKLTISPVSDDLVSIQIDGRGPQGAATFRAVVQQDGKVALFLASTRVIPQVLKLAARFAPKPKVKKVK